LRRQSQSIASSSTSPSISSIAPSFAWPYAFAPSSPKLDATDWYWMPWSELTLAVV
jgi:hypothetical protein